MAHCYNLYHLTFKNNKNGRFFVILWNSQYAEINGSPFAADKLEDLTEHDWQMYIYELSQ